VQFAWHSFTASQWDNFKSDTEEGWDEFLPYYLPPNASGGSHNLFTPMVETIRGPHILIVEGDYV
jgi:hypothetical protein